MDIAFQIVGLPV